MIRVAICDDNKYVCSEIEQVILAYEMANISKIDIEVFYTGESLLDFIKNDHQFDLIFLDVELGTTTGVQVGGHIRNKLDDYISKIIFITSKDGYEGQLFDVQPFNFIKKPLDHGKIETCLKLAIKLLELDNKIFEYKKGYDIIKVDVRDILYFESKRKQIKIVTNSHEDYFYCTLERLREKFSKIFIEPHGSFLVNFHQIQRVTKNSIFMRNGIEIPVSQRNLKNIRNILIDFEKEKRNA